MFQFEHPDFLLLLWSLPLFAVLLVAWWYWRRSVLAKLAAPGLENRLIPGFSPRRFWLKNGLFALALVLLALAWANPQRGVKLQPTTQKSADVFIALDISQSMLAEDVRPSRLVLARIFAQKLVQALTGERIGLIFFAGEAYVQMPLSTDYAAAQSFLTEAAPDLVTAQGTAIPAAIELAEQSFDPESGAGRALIIITDGEDHDSDAVDRAGTAYDKGIVIFGVGAGTAAGGPIPLAPGGVSGYKRDMDNEVVRTSLNETLLRDLARAGGGQAYNLSQGDAAIGAIRNAVDQLQKREVEVRSFTEFESYFQWLLLPALLLLVTEAWIFWKGRNAST